MFMLVLELDLIFLLLIIVLVALQRKDITNIVIDLKYPWRFTIKNKKVKLDKVK